jgi:hypothetical protein
MSDKPTIDETRPDSVKGPHARRLKLNRCREFIEKALFRKDLMEAGRTENEAVWEYKKLAHVHVANLARGDLHR